MICRPVDIEPQAQQGSGEPGRASTHGARLFTDGESCRRVPAARVFYPRNKLTMAAYLKTKFDDRGGSGVERISRRRSGR